jgi:hypothetical protein
VARILQEAVWPDHPLPCIAIEGNFDAQSTSPSRTTIT